MISVNFIMDDLPDGAALDIEEDRGHLVFRIGRHLEPEQIISVLNEGAKQVLAGGHWFQEWKGDIISVSSSCADHADGLVSHIPTQRHLHDVSKPDGAAG